MTTTIELDDNLKAKLEAFKRVYDAVMGEDQSFEHYVKVVTLIGLDRMRRDMVPEGQEWATIEAAYRKDYGFVCDLIAEIWESGSEKQQAKVRETMGRYIS